MNGLASILDCGVPGNINLAGFLVDRHITDMNRETWTGSPGIDVCVTRDLTTCFLCTLTYFCQCHRILARSISSYTVGVFHLLSGDIPDSRCSFFYLCNNFFRGFDHCHTRCEGCTTTTRSRAIRQVFCVSDDGLQIFRFYL